MFHSEAHIFCLYQHINKVSLVSLRPLGLNREELPHSDAEISRSVCSELSSSSAINPLQ